MSFFQQFMKRFRQHSSVRRESRSPERRIAFEPLEERRLLAAVPTTFKADDNGGTSVEIRWDLMLGATGYEVQRSITGIDQWEGFGPALGALHTLDDDFYRSYYFRIRSVEVPASGPTIYSNWTDLADADCTANPVLECPRPTNNPEDNTVKVSAVADPATPKITLQWPEELAYADADYKVYRKEKDETSFALKATLTWTGATITAWPDTDLVADPDPLLHKVVYEYKVERSRNFSATHPFFKSAKTATGYVYAGVDVKLDDADSTIESPGTVVLVIDETQKVALETELDRLQDDLIAEGCKVVVIDNVNPNDTIESVRDKIVDKYDDDPTNLKAVFLIGHIPVPMSGLSSPDGHPPPRPMPADVFYGDMGDAQGNSIWDVDAGLLTENTVPTDGDGKPVELMVGRVDMRGLPNFQQYSPGLTEAQLETELLRRYLDKDHVFRSGQVTVERGALIRDQIAFPDSSTGAWQTMSGLFGPADPAVATAEEPDNIDVTDSSAPTWPFAIGLSSIDSGDLDGWDARGGMKNWLTLGGRCDMLRKHARKVAEAGVLAL